jgi:hypothetical protein
MKLVFYECQHASLSRAEMIISSELSPPSPAPPVTTSLIGPAVLLTRAIAKTQHKQSSPPLINEHDSNKRETAGEQKYEEIEQC